MLDDKPFCILSQFAGGVSTQLSHMMMQYMFLEEIMGKLC